METSSSVSILPWDPRCHYWAKIIRAGDPLPLPSEISGAESLPVPYLQLGDEELFPDDLLFEGQEKDHKLKRGWNYFLTVAGTDGHVLLRYNTDVKARLKVLGLEKRLLPGSGELAGVVRVAHGLRAGLCPYADEVKARILSLKLVNTETSASTRPPRQRL